MDIAKEKERIYSRIGFSKKETENIVNALNSVLANYQLFYQKLRNFHWNVKGSSFFELHALFENQYNEAQTTIDEIAERIRIFNHTPLSNYTDYLKLSTIKESPDDLKSDEMIEVILEDYETLISLINKAANVAADETDSVTEDLLIGFIFSLEKTHWMLSSFKND